MTGRIRTAAWTCQGGGQHRRLPAPGTTLRVAPVAHRPLDNPAGCPHAHTTDDGNASLSPNIPKDHRSRAPPHPWAQVPFLESKAAGSCSMPATRLRWSRSCLRQPPPRPACPETGGRHERNTQSRRHDRRPGRDDDRREPVPPQVNTCGSIPGQAACSPTWRPQLAAVPRSRVPNTRRAERQALTSGHPIVDSHQCVD